MNDTTPATMSFRDAVKRLNIEDYAERIWSSNSHGELFHVMDYIHFATHIKDTSWFRPMFLVAVEYANKHWMRPESCFQHMPRLLREINNSLKETHANR